MIDLCMNPLISFFCKLQDIALITTGKMLGVFYEKVNEEESNESLKLFFVCILFPFIS